LTRKSAPAGTLIAIGGGEDKTGERIVLREIVQLLKGGKLIIATVASQSPNEYFDAYEKPFRELGVKKLAQLYVHDRAEALHPKTVSQIDGATGIFFTGGDQLRIASQIGDTAIEREVMRIYRTGGVIAGTSAGASVMSATMLVKGSSAESHRIGDLHMAPGLGLLRDVIIDQHFAERGRIGRLLGAVGQNPRVLGIGIDEDTAIIVNGPIFRVQGRGAVYVVDGGGVTYSNIAEAKPDRVLSLCDVRLHVLSAGETFDLDKRRPACGVGR
jgi:cyanophycinase